MSHSSYHLLYPAIILFSAALIVGLEPTPLCPKLLTDTGLVLHPILLRLPKVYDTFTPFSACENGIKLIRSALPGFEPFDQHQIYNQPVLASGEGGVAYQLF